MDVSEAIDKRRSYRSLETLEITDETIRELSRAAQLAPSCFNNQPWRLAFATGAKLGEVKKCLSEGNNWAQNASLIIALFSRQQDDCVIKDRVYNQFDVGIAAGFIMLRATELGLVAHPIAGYSPRKVRDALDIPREYSVITLLIVGRHSDELKPELSEKQAETEKERPGRKSLDEISFTNKFKG